ncbi:MAG: hypothetical protein ACXVHJ_31325 [Solirubrobacteraceae bacterium]
MILKVHLQGAPRYEVGDEIWQQSLAAAIAAEAEVIAGYAAADLCPSPGRADRDALRDRIIPEMTAALQRAGDRYTATDGVVYSLLDEPAADPRPGQGTLSAMTPQTRDPVVEEVLRFENLPVGSADSRRAIVRWSDGTEGTAMSWYADEILSPVDRPSGAEAG